MTRAFIGVAFLAAASLGSPAGARPCATLEALAASRDAARFSPRSAFERPPALGFVDSERYSLRVHYPREDLAPRAELVLSTLEDAWRRQVEEQGYPPPLPDAGEGGDARFDAYLGATTPAAALSLASADIDEDDGRHAGYAHLVIEASLPEAELVPVLHHELAHAIQFGIDLSESLMFFEASAVVQEYLYDRDEGFSSLSWASDLDDYQAFPAASPFTDGIQLFSVVGRNSFYEYGAALFLLYLEQEHGAADGALLRRLWLASEQPDEVEENEPDWLDALAEELDGGLAEAVLDFATWRSLLASWAPGDEGLVGGERLPGSAGLTPRRLLGAALDGRPLALGEGELPQPLGCFTLETTAARTGEVPLRVVAEALPDEGGRARPLGVAWLVGAPEVRRVERGVHAGRGEWLELRLSLPAGATARVSVCDVGDADADDPPRPAPLRVRVSRDDVELSPIVDAGPGTGLLDAGISADGGPQEPAGCSCQGAPVSVPTSGRGRARPIGLVVLSFVGMLLFGVRARRAVKRNRLYRQDARRRGS